MLYFDSSMQVLTKEVPWADKESLQLVGLVGYHGMRPMLPSILPRGFPQQFVALIRDCWLQAPQQRPRFPEILLRLENM